MIDTRRRRRRVLYLVGLLPSVLLLLVALRLVLLLVHQERALAAYDQGSFEVAQDEFGTNQILVPVERWVAPFGEGAARYRAQDYAGAVEALTASMSSAPADKECVVRVNLALAEEALGDAALEAGDRGDAEASWSRGIDALGDCAQRLGDPAREAADEIGIRLADKLGKLPPPPLAEPSEPPAPADDFEQRKRQLDQQNEDAREERRESEKDPERPDSEIPNW